METRAQRDEIQTILSCLQISGKAVEKIFSILDIYLLKNPDAIRTLVTEGLQRRHLDATMSRPFAWLPYIMEILPGISVTSMPVYQQNNYGVIITLATVECVLSEAHALENVVFIKYIYTIKSIESLVEAMLLSPSLWGLYFNQMRPLMLKVAIEEL